MPPHTLVAGTSRLLPHEGNSLIPYTLMPTPLSFPPAMSPAATGSLYAPPPFFPDADEPEAWYGNIQYLINISAVGAASCLLLFLFVKLRSDHGIPGPAALFAKLLAAYHATATQIALHCGADAAQFLGIERSSFIVLASLSVIAIVFALPLNLWAGDAPIVDQFTRTTISHISAGSSLLWLHFIFMVLVVVVAHLGICRMEDELRITRFRDGSGNPSDPNSNSVAIFTIMIQGIPKTLASSKGPLEEYFQHRYPGKVYRVIVPFDLCSLDYLTTQWDKVQNEISMLEAGANARSVTESEDDGLSSWTGSRMWRKLNAAWATMVSMLGLTDEERLRKLRNFRLVLETKLLDYREGRAPGAGIAFVVFKDVYTTNKAVRDFRAERKKPIGRFFPLMELQLGRSSWRVERAPPATDIYWNHLGLSKLSSRLCRVAVNTCLLVMLLFCSSPLAVITAMKSAARIINAEAMDSAKSWFTWLEGSSWFAAIILQFLPNVLIFVSMYIIIPSALSYLSKFERHLTVSGEQRAALLKMVCFFLVNLILLRALVESSLESALLRMGRCYLEGEDCKRMEHYMSASFLSKSCLSSLAFLITSTFLGISFDLLAPIPWIKKTFKKFRKNDMIQLVPEQNDDFPVEKHPEENESDNLRTPLMSERQDSSVLNGIDGHVLSVYPINRSFHVPKQMFDFAQYYAFNLTIFALTMIYSLFTPLVVPVGAFYFGYRFIVDKYNFLFVYRVRGFPAGNDGKLMDRVLCLMHFCVIFFLLAMLLFFSVQGDSTKLQAIFTLGLLFFYKLLPSKYNGFQPSILETMQTVDSFFDGETDYEVFSRPEFDWDLYQS